MRSTIRRLLALGLFALCTPCTALPPNPPPCSSSAECPDDLVCTSDGLCSPKSRPDSTAGSSDQDSKGVTTPPSAESSSGISSQTDGGSEHDAQTRTGMNTQPDRSAGSGATTGAAGASSGTAKSRPFGAECTSATQCASAMCTNGVCCQQAACGACQTCGAKGQCEPTTDPDQLASSGCLPNGAACDAAASCMSRSCVDGRCCGASNCALCMSCAVAGKEGNCEPVGGRDDPDGCSGNQSCAAGMCAAKAVGAVASPGAFEMFSGMGRLAQTISIPMAGQLLEVRLGADCGSGQFAVDVFDVATDGAPGRARIATAEVPAGIVPGTRTIAGFALKPPLRVNAGDKLAIVFSLIDTGLTCSLDHSSGDVYVPGAAYKDAGAQAWARLPYDFAFDLLTGR